MLSILIPIYNFDITELISELSNQAEQLKIPYEIICIDDKSDEYFSKKNEGLDDNEKVNYTKLTKNIGRSKIRNLLTFTSKYENLLLLDCDIKIDNPNFLSNYVNALKESDVIVGGIEYEPLKNINVSHKLRWIYGKKREAKKAKERTKNPYESFSACNLIIKKKISDKLFFLESISQYGHEDTLYGIELKSHNIKVNHIDNQVLHLGLDNTEEFIRKTELSLENFKSISKLNPEIISLTKIGRYTKLFSATLFLTKPLFKVMRNLSKSVLLRGSTNLLFFDLFKLSFLLTLEEK